MQIDVPALAVVISATPVKPHDDVGAKGLARRCLYCRDFFRLKSHFYSITLGKRIKNRSYSSRHNLRNIRAFAARCPKHYFRKSAVLRCSELAFERRSLAQQFLPDGSIVKTRDTIEFLDRKSSRVSRSHCLPQCGKDLWPFHSPERRSRFKLTFQPSAVDSARLVRRIVQAFRLIKLG